MGSTSFGNGTTNTGLQMGVNHGEINIISNPVGSLGLMDVLRLCLNIANEPDAPEALKSDYRDRAARFKSLNDQLRQWTQAVGLEEDGMTLSEIHDSRLDDLKTFTGVKNLFLAIGDICDTSDDCDGNEPLQASSTDDRHIQAYSRIESRAQNLKWVTSEGGKRTAQAKQLESMIGLLYKLIPIDTETNLSPYHVQGVDFQDRQGWMAIFQNSKNEMEKESQTEIRRNLQTWLFGTHLPNDMYVTCERHRATRERGTCEWILHRPWFLDWLSPEFPKDTSKVLWVNGPPGYGKSMLCSKIIDNMLATADNRVAFFFFRSDIERNDPLVIAQSWISQLMSHAVALDLVHGYWARRQGKKATRADIMRIIQGILQAIPGCTVIVDGLDECRWLHDSPEGDEFSSASAFLDALRPAIVDSNSRLLIFSRNEPEIRTCLFRYSQQVSLFTHTITSKDVDSDLVAYSQGIVGEALQSESQSKKAKDLGRLLASRCDGQFLWISLQMKSISPKAWTNQRLLQETISIAPTDLASTYKRNWAKILELPDEDQARAVNILRWLLFSFRPLTVQEFAEALLISEDCDMVLVNEAPDDIDENFARNGILYYCGSLIDIRQSEDGEDGGSVATNTVHLAHFSVKEYLLHRLLPHEAPPWFPPETFSERSDHALLAKMCLRYLTCLSEWQGSFRLEDSSFRGTFYDYAAGSWYRHAAVSWPEDSEVLGLVNLLFDTTRPNWAFWRRWFDRHDDESTAIKKKSVVTREPSPLYYAARFGFAETLKYLIEDKRHAVDKTGPYGKTALLVACERGDDNLVKLLLECGANPATPDDENRSPIWCAAQNGHSKVVRLLIDYGSNITARNSRGWTPLNIASDRGHFDTVTILLESGADFSVRQDDRMSPLYCASLNNHFRVAKLLIDKGADHEAQHTNGWTPLNIAASKGYIDLVELLIQNGADINLGNIDKRSPIHSALLNGHLEVTKMLLQNGAAIEVRDFQQFTPLGLAAMKSHREIVEILLKKGANPNVQGPDKRTPLYYAADHGNLDMVKLLVEAGADISIRQREGMAPIYGASFQNHRDVVEYLIEKGADFKSPYINKWTPVNVASDQGHTDMVRLLLDHGADMKIVNYNGSKPLLTASRNGHLEVVKLLLSRGANISDINDHGWMPLHAAAAGGHFEVCRFLLESQASANIGNKDDWTPLHEACHYGHRDVCTLLLENGADATSQDNIGRTPSKLASNRGHNQVVDLLQAWIAQQERNQQEMMHTLQAQLMYSL
ncbi:hypothetical protein N7456_010650 [Penicillium angulare]|uniref:Nephrocystin 3-like N-terminal domain-containing protein n=1 Tax=Penicillium angulare TaxID=116970 RepID=A0A9W9F798_9EURO|nr:hypothetical protein N7456_010650 [Penicillium angulare]